MDAVEFIKARERMCGSYNGCAECPLRNEVCSRVFGINADKIVPIVEQWAKEHPIKTRQSVFLEQWPNADIDEHGVLDIYPCCVDTKKYTTGNGKCNRVDCRCKDCRREFWMQEVE